MKIRQATLDDFLGIKAVYENVLQNDIHNLTPYLEEITDGFIMNELKNALTRGYAFVVEKDNEIVGYAKAYTGIFFKESHILKNATLIFCTKQRKTILPYKLLNFLLNYVNENMPHIQYFQTQPYSFNKDALRLYKKFGFQELFETKNTIKLNNGEYANEVFLQLESTRKDDLK
jgi:hypothetical protein